MFKFFRKYNKWILAIGGSLLMIVFLFPTAAGSFFAPSRAARPVGWIGEQPVSRTEAATAAAEIRVLSSLHPLLGRTLRHMVRRTDRIRPSVHWLLLVREARKLGIYAGSTQARSFLNNIGVTSERVSQVMQSFGTTEQFILQALRHWIMVQKLSNLLSLQAATLQGQFPLTRASEPRLRHLAQGLQSEISFKMLPIDASLRIQSVDEPSREQLLALFKKYKDQPPGRSEPYGFGYRLPDRVKLVYLPIPLDRVAASVEIGEVEAHRYYLEHKSAFMPAKVSSDAEKPQARKPADEQPTSEERKPQQTPSQQTTADAQAPDQPLPYTQVRQEVRKQLRRHKARQKRQEIIQWAMTRLRSQTRRYPSERGYRKLPEDYQPLSFEKLAAAIEERFDVRLSPVRIADQWLTLEEVSELQGLGEATLRISGRSFPITQYITSTRELDPPSSHSLLNLRLQVGVAARPVTGPEGTKYLFRLIAAQEAHVPASLSEVKQKVVRDFKLREAYESLKKDADKLLARARKKGLEALAKALKEQGTKVRSVGPISRRRFGGPFSSSTLIVPSVPVLGQSEPFIDAVFELAENVREAGGLDQVKRDQVMAAIPVDQARKLVLVRLTEYQPVTKQRFQAIKPLLMRRLGIQLTQAQLFGGQGPLSPTAVARRLNYSPAEAVEQQDTGEASEQAQPVTAGT